MSLPWDHPRRLLRRGWPVLGRDEGGPSRVAAGHRAATPQAPLTAHRPRPVRLGEPRPPPRPPAGTPAQPFGLRRPPPLGQGGPDGGQVPVSYTHLTLPTKRIV